MILDSTECLKKITVLKIKYICKTKTIQRMATFKCRWTNLISSDVVSLFFFILCHIGNTPSKYGMGFIIKKTLKTNIEFYWINRTCGNIKPPRAYAIHYTSIRTDWKSERGRNRGILLHPQQRDGNSM